MRHCYISFPSLTLFASPRMYEVFYDCVEVSPHEVSDCFCLVTASCVFLLAIKVVVLLAEIFSLVPKFVEIKKCCMLLFQWTYIDSLPPELFWTLLEHNPAYQCGTVCQFVRKILTYNYRREMKKKKRKSCMWCVSLWLILRRNSSYYTHYGLEWCYLIVMAAWMNYRCVYQSVV